MVCHSRTLWCVRVSSGPSFMFEANISVNCFGHHNCCPNQQRCQMTRGMNQQTVLTIPKTSVESTLRNGNDCMCSFPPPAGEWRPRRWYDTLCVAGPTLLLPLTPLPLLTDSNNHEPQKQLTQKAKHWTLASFHGNQSAFMDPTLLDSAPVLHNPRQGCRAPSEYHDLCRSKGPTRALLLCRLVDAIAADECRCELWYCRSTLSLP